MARTIETGIRKPAERPTTSRQEKSIERTIRKPASSFDKRVTPGSVTYLGPSKLESQSSAIKAGKTQSKKHVSSGRGQ